MFYPSAIVALLVLAQAPADLRGERDAIGDRETKALDALAARLKGDEAEAVRALRVAPPAADGSTRFVPLGEIIGPADRKLPDDVTKVRLDAALSYFALAQKALKANPQRLAVADECLRAVAARDRGHAEAHRLLGYVPRDGGWATPFAVTKLTNGLVLHPTYGWVEKDWVPHLDRSELPAPKEKGRPTKWLPRAEADALRREFARGWQIRTEHFAILTNVPLAEAIDFGRHLEALGELFTSRMADVIGPADLPLAKLAKNPKLAPTLAAKKPHRVNYYADKQEYVDTLAPAQGAEIRNTLGIFLPAKELPTREGVGVSFFYRDPGGQLAETETLFHEVSHQLLFEMTPGKYDPGKENFWVYEGLGAYFETLRPQPDGSLRVGGLVGKRISVAQDRLIARGEFIPIGRMATYNKFLFNGGNGGDIYLNYAEAMALAVYFMDAHGGRYREDFLDYAHDVYKGRIKPGMGKPLEARVGVDDRTLGRDFLSYLKPRAETRAEGQ
jgi:hypothetical protein